VIELIQRTNQFNTTLVRLNGRELLDIVNLPQGAVYTLEVSDRFASYGLVGACLLWNDEITNFVLSCRVIPLNTAVPFLSAVLQHHGRAPIRATIVEGPRNQPCRSLYSDAGFESIESGKYVLSHLANLTPIDPGIHHVELYDGNEAVNSVGSKSASEVSRKGVREPAFNFGED
jgi:predicted enzyme involved in methoxymalonyl-ACP biosynthesis